MRVVYLFILISPVTAEAALEFHGPKFFLERGSFVENILRRISIERFGWAVVARHEIISSIRYGHPVRTILRVFFAECECYFSVLVGLGVECIVGLDVVTTKICWVQGKERVSAITSHRPEQFYARIIRQRHYERSIGASQFFPGSIYGDLLIVGVVIGLSSGFQMSVPK